MPGANYSVPESGRSLKPTVVYKATPSGRPKAFICRKNPPRGAFFGLPRPPKNAQKPPKRPRFRAISPRMGIRRGLRPLRGTPRFRAIPRCPPFQHQTGIGLGGQFHGQQGHSGQAGGIGSGHLRHRQHGHRHCPVRHCVALAYAPVCAHLFVFLYSHSLLIVFSPRCPHQQLSLLSNAPHQSSARMTGNPLPVGGLRRHSQVSITTKLASPSSSSNRQ